LQRTQGWGTLFFYQGKKGDFGTRSDQLSSGLGRAFLRNFCWCRVCAKILFVRSHEPNVRLTLKLVANLILLLVGLSPLSYAAAQTQVFSTSAGPVKITPLYHASTLIEAGGKVIYLDPAKPAKLATLPKADLILITDIH